MNGGCIRIPDSALVSLMYFSWLVFFTMIPRIPTERFSILFKPLFLDGSAQSTLAGVIVDSLAVHVILLLPEDNIGRP